MAITSERPHKRRTARGDVPANNGGSRKDNAAICSSGQGSRVAGQRGAHGGRPIESARARRQAGLVRTSPSKRGVARNERLLPRRRRDTSGEPEEEKEPLRTKRHSRRRREGHTQHRPLPGFCRARPLARRSSTRARALGKYAAGRGQKGAALPRRPRGKGCSPPSATNNPLRYGSSGGGDLERRVLFRGRGSIPPQLVPAGGCCSRAATSNAGRAQQKRRRGKARRAHPSCAPGYDVEEKKIIK